MLPFLAPGDEVFLDQDAYLETLPRTGDVVVAWHPRQSELRIVKRIAAVHPDGSVDLEGANPSVSSSYSRVPQGKIVGRVTSRLP